jgi:hypothetical protein
MDIMMTGRTQEEVGIRPGFLVVVRVVDRVLELFVRESARDTFVLDTLVTTNMLLPEIGHLRSMNLQWSLNFFYTMPMCLLALLDMFQLIFHHKHMHFQLYW